MNGSGMPHCNATDRWVIKGGYQDLQCDAQPVYDLGSRQYRCERHKNDRPGGNPPP